MCWVRRSQVTSSSTSRIGVARAVLLITYASVIIGCPILLYEIIRRSNVAGTSPARPIVWLIGFSALLLTLPVSVSDIVGHLLAFRVPVLQKQVVRLLALPVVFSACALIALIVPEAVVVTEVVRDGYEALGIYYFTSFLIDAAGGDAALSSRLRMKPASAGRHLPPASWCLRPWPLGSRFLRRCKAGVLQYVVVRLVLTAVVVGLEAQGAYEEGRFALDSGYLYVTIVANCSQLVAVYCLLLLLQAAHEELTPVRAWPKLLCVKAVIFFAWWQSVALAVLVQLGLMPTTIDVTEQQVAKGLQNLLIVVEMLPAALAHRWAFPVSDFTGAEDELAVQPHTRHKRRTRASNVAQPNGAASGSAAVGGDKDRSNTKLSQASVDGVFALEDDSEDQEEETNLRAHLSADDSGSNGSVPSAAAAAATRAHPRRVRRGQGRTRSRSSARQQEVELTSLTTADTDHKHAPGLLAAVLASAIPTDVVADIRRTVMPSPARHSSSHSAGHTVQPGMARSGALRRSSASSGPHQALRASALPSSTDEDAALSLVHGANDHDWDDEQLLHAAQEYSARMHRADGGGAGAAPLRRAQRQANDAATGSASTGPAGSTARRGGAGAVSSSAASRAASGRSSGRRSGVGRSRHSKGSSAWGVDAVNTGHMEAAAVTTLASARVVAAQQSPGSALAATNTPLAPAVPAGVTTMSANRVRRKHS